MDETSTDAALPPIDEVLSRARERFETSVDFTLGVEEEYALCDPETLDLTPGFERVAAEAAEVGLDGACVGELIASEAEFRTGRCETWADACAEVLDLRSRVPGVMRAAGVVGATSGTHPWADYRAQGVIDLPYYNRLVERMQFVARRNNTFGLHVHVGVRGADRAIAVADALRNVQALMLALSCSSPFLDGADTGLCSTRAQIFSRSFPRANIAPAFRTFDGFIDRVAFLHQVGSIDSAGQLWWGVRPHVLHGTVEFRMFDGQPDVRDTLAIVALAQGTVADLCRRFDAGERVEPLPADLVDENLWRAMRWGTDAMLIDLPGSTMRPAVEHLADLVAAAREAGREAGLGIDAGLDRVEAMLDRGCATKVQRELLAEAGGDLRVPYASVVEATMTSATLAASGI